MFTGLKILDELNICSTKMSMHQLSASFTQRHQRWCTVLHWFNPQYYMTNSLMLTVKMIEYRKHIYRTDKMKQNFSILIFSTHFTGYCPLITHEGGWVWGGRRRGGTHAGPEVGRVEFWVVLILHGVINTVALPHQVVAPAQNRGIHFIHICEKQNLLLSLVQ